MLCIDTDPQCNLSIVSGINFMEQEHNLYTLLKGESTLDQCIVKSKYYDLIPGSLLLAYADTEFNQKNREYLLQERIKNANYDVILIDSPPALRLMNIMSLTVSSKIIIPTECSYLAMVGLKQIYNTIQSIHKHSNKDLCVLGILLIKYNGRANINIAVSNALEKLSVQMNTKVFACKIRETIKVKEAQSQQEPIIDWDPSCTAVQDYLDFVKKLTSNLA
ncbi:MAG: ParA family protein [Clostridium sp.]|nr:ParA family protein [Clostridiaceae bacterium]